MSNVVQQRVPEGYKQTELGEIPEDWELRRLGEFLKYEQPTPYLVSDTEYSKNGEVPVLTAGKTFLLGYTHEKHGIFRSLPVIIFDDFTTATKFVDFPFKAKSSAMKMLLPRTDDVNLHYIFSLMQMIDFPLGNHKRHWIGEYQHLNVAVPSVEEQTAIANALSDVDALITSLEKLIAKKRDIKTAAMQLLLTGKKRLPPFDQTHTGYKQTDLGEIPEDWEVVELGSLSHIRTGSMNGQDKVEDGIYPFYVRSQSVERINSYSYECEAILVPGEGNIGNIFHYINGRFNAHQRVYVIQQFSEEYSAKYIFYYMKENFGRHAMENSVKATVDSLRLPTFLEFNVAKPSIEEQTAIANVLTDMNKEINTLEQRLNKTQQIKKGMMQELLTGRTRLV